ncbi:MAG: hypothetical protein E7354_03055 [Clostridiales bacterium]|nr:hypothetical protein [Clostridiales bacterium]
MKVTKIVITGGPCGGKTSALSFVEKEMTKRGYKVVFIGETATELILSGLHPKSYKRFTEFEKAIIQLQLMKESYYEKECENLPDDKVLLVCDRGAMDCKGYVGEEKFQKILNDLGLDEITLRDNYAGVFHLVTAAKGAEEYYTLSNNQARRETVKEAIEMDDNTISSWTGSPHFRVIDNSTPFDEKLKRLVKEICSCLGEPIPMEIERKYLIKKPNLEELEAMPNCSKVDIVQTYLQTDDGSETRIRQRGRDGSYVYTVTSKKKISAMQREEVERRITEKEYLTLMMSSDFHLKQVKKTRYLLTYDNRYYEIDVYPFSKKKAICEIELSDKNEEVSLPPFIKIIKEVTGDKAYSNYAFASSIPEDMLK